MLTQRIIPCLDIDNGRVVKGVKFADLRDAGDPVEQAQRYQLDGADEIVMLDVSATTSGRATALETVRAVRRVLSIPLSVGGGIRSVDHALALLAAGADKVGVNSAAVEHPELVGDLSDRVGAQCVVLSIDAALREDGNGWEVVTRAGTNRTGIDALAWAQRAAEMGAGEILLTSFDQDGTQDGYAIKLLEAVRGVTDLPVIASGGAAHARHMLDAFQAGADAVLAASIFHNQTTTPNQLKSELAESGVEVRMP
ncbi:MAG: imidazole glycerol phosphate synthase subunit HisF [Phycisphaerales bacterium]|nr:imidazole glycerol phosphate synthase subunit HisF [Phycisphaerales bacterium]